MFLNSMHTIMNIRRKSSPRMIETNIKINKHVTSRAGKDPFVLLIHVTSLGIYLSCRWTYTIIEYQIAVAVIIQLSR